MKALVAFGVFLFFSKFNSALAGPSQIQCEWMCSGSLDIPACIKRCLGGGPIIINQDSPTPKKTKK